MSKIGEKTKEIIRDHIADVLYSAYPLEVSTYYVAKNIGRNKEFVKKLLYDLKKIGLVIESKKDKRGFPLAGNRSKWKMKWDFVRALKEKN